MKFNERFDIEVGLQEAQKRFVHRTYNELIWGFVYGLSQDEIDGIHRAIASELGNKYISSERIDMLIRSNFFRNLQAIEAIYAYFSPDRVSKRQSINAIIHKLLSQSETDLGIQWQDGNFVRKALHYSIRSWLTTRCIGFVVPVMTAY
jgi:hypothetical protein